MGRPFTATGGGMLEVMVELLHQKIPDLVLFLYVLGYHSTTGEVILTF